MCLFFFEIQNLVSQVRCVSLGPLLWGGIVDCLRVFGLAASDYVRGQWHLRYSLDALWACDWTVAMWMRRMLSRFFFCLKLIVVCVWGVFSWFGGVVRKPPPPSWHSEVLTVFVIGWPCLCFKPNYQIPHTITQVKHYALHHLKNKKKSPLTHLIDPGAGTRALLRYVGSFLQHFWAYHSRHGSVCGIV